MSDILNIIHLPKNLFEEGTVEYEEAVFREDNIKKQVQENSIQDYKIWDGVYMPQIPFMGINLAFKRLITHAKETGLKSMVIAEDDFALTCPTSWGRFLDTTPKDFDIFMGCVFDAQLNSENRIMFGYCGNTILRVHERFYEAFLNMKVDNNLDREIGRFAHKYKYIVANPFIATQLGGYSFHQKKNVENYDYLIVGRDLYGR